MTSDDASRRLQEIPNVGPAVARRLATLGFEGPESLRGQDPELLFERCCALAGRREDACLLDTLHAVVVLAEGGPARPWWHYSALRRSAVAPGRRTGDQAA